MSLATSPTQLTTANRNGWLVVTVQGGLDHASSPVLRQILLDADDVSGRRIVLDLTDVDFLDSAGLGVIAGARERARSRFGSLHWSVRNRRLVSSTSPGPWRRWTSTSP